MKIAIAGNHSFPQVGGSEKVIQQISEALSSDYSHEVSVFSQSVREHFIHNSVSYKRLPQSGNQFVNQLDSDKFDHLLVYSDLFYHWSAVLESAEKTRFSKSVVLVGANATLSSPIIQRKFRQKHNLFTIITHSNNYQDFKICQDWNIPVVVIPNGVDLREFDNSIENDFKKKFGVKSDNLFVCVSNFFPGKGQEYVHAILSLLSKKLENSPLKTWEMIFISTSLPYPFCKLLEDKAKKSCKNLPVKFLSDLPRQDTINAFKSATGFVFPSQKEVAPLVVLEAMAARTPWVALPVGNVSSLEGGFTIPYKAKDASGNCLYGPESYEWFAERLYQLVVNPELRVLKGEEGRRAVEEKYNWKTISSQYNQIFSIKKE